MSNYPAGVSDRDFNDDPNGECEGSCCDTEPEAQPRRHCSKCGEELGFSEADPCSKCETEAQPQGVKLLPCPFCGAKGHVRERERDRRVKNPVTDYYIECQAWMSSKGCSAVPKTKLYDSVEKAVAAWNARADLPRATAADTCWHCGVTLAGVLKPRCEDCPDECDIEGCDAFGCTAPRATGGTTVEEWLPIETAPRDARSILIYCPESGDVYQAYRFDGDEQWRMFNSGGRVIYQQPSLWRSLPSPVRAAAQTKAESGEK